MWFVKSGEVGSFDRSGIGRWKDDMDLVGFCDLSEINWKSMENLSENVKEFREIIFGD